MNKIKNILNTKHLKSLLKFENKLADFFYVF